MENFDLCGVFALVATGTHEGCTSIVVPNIQSYCRMGYQITPATVMNQPLHNTNTAILTGDVKGGVITMLKHNTRYCWNQSVQT
jgi:hypothetical protein